MKITDKTLIKRKSDIVFSKMDNEVVMLSIENGEYYGLDEIGTRIWEVIEHEITFLSLIDLLKDEFDVSEEICKRDTIGFLHELHKKNLLLIQNEI